MKKLVAVLALLLGCSCAAHAGPTKVDPASYTIPVHVSAARWVTEGTSAILDLDVVISGTKYELQGAQLSNKQVLLLAPGNYKARILNDIHNASGTVGQGYELLLLDNSTTWRGWTSGVSE